MSPAKRRCSRLRLGAKSSGAPRLLHGPGGARGRRPRSEAPPGRAEPEPPRAGPGTGGAAPGRAGGGTGTGPGPEQGPRRPGGEPRGPGGLRRGGRGRGGARRRRKGPARAGLRAQRPRTARAPAATGRYGQGSGAGGWGLPLPSVDAAPRPDGCRWRCHAGRCRGEATPPSGRGARAGRGGSAGAARRRVRGRPGTAQPDGTARGGGARCPAAPGRAPGGGRGSPSRRAQHRAQRDRARGGSLAAVLGDAELPWPWCPQ